MEKLNLICTISLRNTRLVQSKLDFWSTKINQMFSYFSFLEPVFLGMNLGEKPRDASLLAYRFTT